MKNFFNGPIPSHRFLSGLLLPALPRLPLCIVSGQIWP